MDSVKPQEEVFNMETVGCPFKKIKLDSEEQFEHDSFVTTIGDSCINSNGGESGIMPAASELQTLDENAEVDGGFVENGEHFKVFILY
jgi:hypothetical protein